jgi:hypothetical protein
MSRRPADDRAALALVAELLDESLSLLSVERARVAAVGLRARGVDVTSTAVLGLEAAWWAAVVQPLVHGELTAARVAVVVGQIRQHLDEGGGDR